MGLKCFVTDFHFCLGVLFLEGLKTVKEKFNRRINGDCFLGRGVVIRIFEGRKTDFLILKGKNKNKEVCGSIMPPGCWIRDAPWVTSDLEPSFH